MATSQKPQGRSSSNLVCSMHAHDPSNSANKNLSGHVTLAAILDFQKNLIKILKIFFSKSTHHSRLRFGTHAHLTCVYQVCSRHDDWSSRLAAILFILQHYIGSGANIKYFSILLFLGASNVPLGRSK